MSKPSRRNPSALAVCSASHASVAIALAPCSFALPASSSGPVEMQLLPAGEFTPSDGRDLPVKHWRIDGRNAPNVIAAFNARKNPAVVDYEHQTLRKEENGQPAPAAGWMTGLIWRDGQGLFATTDFTARASQQIDAHEYRYVSPVFTFDKVTGDVLSIEMAAITNTPAIDGMQPLALRAAATFIHPTESSMNKLLAAVIAALSLSADATEDQAVAAVNARAKDDPLAPVRMQLGLAADAKPDAVVAACTSLKARAEASANPDPAKFVSVETFESVKTELAALTGKSRKAEVEALVMKGLDEAKLLPAQEAWARELGEKDVAALTKYLAATAPIAALTRTQTRGNSPEGGNEHGLTDEEIAVCNSCGIAPEAYAKSKKA